MSKETCENKSTFCKVCETVRCILAVVITTAIVSIACSQHEMLEMSKETMKKSEMMMEKASKMMDKKMDMPMEMPMDMPSETESETIN